MSLPHPRAAALATAFVPAPVPPSPAQPPADAAPPAGPAACAAPVPAPFAIDRLDAVDAAAHRDAWADLAGRALEPNAFLDPDFALPAAQHLAGRRRPCFVLVWSTEAGERRDLVAVCPVVGRRWPLAGLATAWLHDLSTVGLPLLDRDRADLALQALLGWAGPNLRGASGLVVPSLPADGPTASALRRAAGAAGLDCAVLAGWERAALRTGDRAGDRAGSRAGLPGPSSPSGLLGLLGLSPKNAKELRRQRRRLEERGNLLFASASTDEALRGEVERFLCLEAGGWKGAAGTAMLCSPGRTAFLRTVTRLLARRGLCRIESLTLDGAPVAMAVILSAGDADFLWKIAYREDAARFSPGVQLVLDITRHAQAAEVAGAADRGPRPGRAAPRAATIDSCAVPGHPMIDRLWRDRIPLCDLAVATRPGGGAGFRRAVALDGAARRLRAEAKRLALAWRARRADRPPA